MVALELKKNTPPKRLDHEKLEQQERQAKRFWCSVVVFFLGLQICLGATAVYLAHCDPTVAVIPDYYKSAVNWDATRRARQHMAKLGWKLEIQAEEPVSAERRVAVQVTGRQGQLVGGLRMTARVYHHARGDEVHQIAFREDSPGRYFGSTKLTQAGLWKFEFRLEGGHGVAESVEDIQVR